MRAVTRRAFALGLAGAALMAWRRPVRAAELTGEERKDWIKGLRSVDDTNCCAEADGEDVYWEASLEAESGYKVFTKDGEWKLVPMGGLITEPNRIGKALVWLTFTLDNGGTTSKRPKPGDERTIVSSKVRCFLPGAAY